MSEDTSAPHWFRKRAPVLAIALCTVPLLVPYHWLPTPSFYGNWLALMIGVALLATSLLANAPRAKLELQLPWAALAAVALAVIVLIQHFLALVPYFQFVAAAVFSLLLASGLVWAGAYMHTRELEWFRPLAWALVIAGMAQSSWAIAQVFGYELVGFELVRRPDGVPLRVGGLLMQANMFAVVVTWSAIAVVYLVAIEAINRRLASLIALVQLVMLSLTASLSPILYLLVGAPLAGLYVWRIGRPRLALAILLSPAALVLIRLSVQTLLNYFDPALTRGDAAPVGTRLVLIQDAWSIFTESPLIGHGWGTFAGARFFDPSAHAIELNNDHAHNALLHLLAETGVLGALGAAVGGLFVLATVLRQELKAERAMCAGIVLVVALYSFIEYPLWLPIFLMPTALLVGVLAPVGPTFFISRGFVRTLLVGCLSGVVLLAVVLADYVVMEQRYREFFATGKATSPQRPAAFFRLEEEQLRLRSAPLDPFTAPLDAPIAARVVSVAPAPEFAEALINQLVLRGETERAAWILERSCSWHIYSCRTMLGNLTQLSEKLGGPFVEFESGIVRPLRRKTLVD